MNIEKVISLAGLFCLLVSSSSLNAQSNAFSTYDKSGTYSIEKVSDVGPNKAYDVFRPKTLCGKGEKHAIITWGNGTGCSVTTYEGLLEHLATHGFVVVASHSSSTGSGMEMAQGVTWLLEENDRNGSEYYQKLNSQVAGATGHSQGGAGTIQSCTHTDKITSIAPLAPATFTAPIFYSTSHVKALMFIMAGSEDVLANPVSVRTTSWDSFGKNGIGLYGELTGATHFEEVGDAGKFKKYVTAWFDATLNNNQEAVRMIFNSDGALHTEPTEWSTLLSKNLDLYASNNQTPIVNRHAPFEENRHVPTVLNAGVFSLNTRIENSNLVLQNHDGKQFGVDVYTLKGALVHNATFVNSCTLPFPTFGAKGAYVTTVNNGERILLKQKMMITR